MRHKKFSAKNSGATKHIEPNQTESNLPTYIIFEQAKPVTVYATGEHSRPEYNQLTTKVSSKLSEYMERVDILSDDDLVDALYQENPQIDKQSYKETLFLSYTECVAEDIYDILAGDNQSNKSNNKSRELFSNIRNYLVFWKAWFGMSIDCSKFNTNNDVDEWSPEMDAYVFGSRDAFINLGTHHIMALSGRYISNNVK